MKHKEFLEFIEELDGYSSAQEVFANINWSNFSSRQLDYIDDYFNKEK